MSVVSCRLQLVAVVDCCIGMLIFYITSASYPPILLCLFLLIDSTLACLERSHTNDCSMHGEDLWHDIYGIYGIASVFCMSSQNTVSFGAITKSVRTTFITATYLCDRSLLFLAITHFKFTNDVGSWRRDTVRNAIESSNSPQPFIPRHQWAGPIEEHEDQVQLLRLLGEERQRVLPMQATCGQRRVPRG